MKKQAKELNLADLPKHVQDLKMILDMYLDPKAAKKFLQANHLIFHVTGTGYDGERQILYMNKQGVIRRCYNASAATSFKIVQLPAETGKALYMLKSMGYQLPEQSKRQAQLYRTYIDYVYSNLNHL